MGKTGSLPIDVHPWLDALFRLCVVGLLGHPRQLFSTVSTISPTISYHLYNFPIIVLGIGNRKLLWQFGQSRQIRTLR